MRTPCPLVFVSSLSVLSFEILLVRIFSIRFSYHYASLIISLSMAGLVIGGLLAFFRQTTVSRLDFSSPQLLQHVAAALAISCPTVFILLSMIPLDHVRMLWEDIQVVYLLIFILLCTIPFLFYGFFISLALSSWREKANMVYASDLTGGAAGLLAVLLLMNSMRIEYVFIIVTIVVGCVVTLTLKRTVLRVVFGLIILALCLLIALGPPLKISPYKGLVQALKDDGARHITTIYTSHSQLDLFENPRIKFAPGLSLSFADHVPGGMGMALDGDIAGIVFDENNLTSFDFLPYLPSALPYLIIQPKVMVIIGARNNIDLLQAGYFGVRDIYMSEHDASVLKYLISKHKNRGPSAMPVFVGSGRNLVKSLNKEIWLIFLSKTGFFPSGSFGLQEDYELTVDAIESYIRSLKEDGILFIQMFLLPPPRLELRLAGNIGTALKNIGILDTHKHLLIYRSWDTINFLVKRNGLSEVDFRRIGLFLGSRQFDLLYPHIAGQERFITGLDYPGLFSQVLNSESSANFVSSYTFDIRETTDDRPFFHYFLKFSKVVEVFELSGRKWAYFLHEGMFLPFIFIFLMFLAVCIFAAAFLISRYSQLKQGVINQRLAASSLIYFALIGFAFMFVEVFFIHRLILSFGSSVKAFLITLVTILLSAGIGSLASGWAVLRKSMWVIALAPLLIGITYFLFDRFDENTMSFSFIIPIGVVLGFFFPRGIRLLAGEQTGAIPLAYATNGAASVIAPSLASLLAVAYGCKILLIIAVILYTLSLIFLFLHEIGGSKNARSSGN
jgi:hypothetical protein